jgi:hypothetical protein
LRTLRLDAPCWAGLWLGPFPTVETIWAHVTAVLFVVGSYLLAERLRSRDAGPAQPPRPALALSRD